MQGAKFKQFQAEGGTAVLNREKEAIVCTQRLTLAWRRLVLICRTRHAQIEQQRARSQRDQNRTAKPFKRRSQIRFWGQACVAHFFCLCARTPPPPPEAHMKQNGLMVQTTAFPADLLFLQISFGCLCAQRETLRQSSEGKWGVGTHTAVCLMLLSSQPPHPTP